MDIYINCVNDGGTYTGSGGNLFYSANPGTIGRNDVDGVNPYHFKGKLDEIRYWNRALTPLEVQMLCGVLTSAGPGQTICAGQSVMIGGNPSAQNGVAPYTYSWSPTAGLNDPNSATPIASPSATTTYTLTVTDNLSNISTSSVTVTVNPSPIVSLGPDVQICNNASTTLNAGSGFSSYLWSTTQNSQSITVYDTGTYSVTVTNSFGCSAADTIIVTNNPDPVINLGPDITICQGQTATLNAGGGHSSYLWSTSDTTQIITISQSGTYYGTVTNNYGCSASDTINVTMNPSPVISLGTDTTICIYEPDTLAAGAGFSTYLWSTAETGQTIVVSSSGTYSVTVSNSYGCTGSDAVIINTIVEYDASILPPWEYCDYHTSVLLLAATPGGTWSGQGITDQHAGIFSPATVGIGSYEITYTIEGACGNSDTVMISVIDCTIPDPHVYIPNVFSLNGDGENDVLYVRGEGITGLEFIVFNRWGEKIFESVDVNHGWDGAYKGIKCMSGVYTYMANVTFSNLQQVVKSGTITLVR